MLYAGYARFYLKHTLILIISYVFDIIIKD